MENENESEQRGKYSKGKKQLQELLKRYNERMGFPDDHQEEKLVSSELMGEIEKLLKKVKKKMKEVAKMIS